MQVVDDKAIILRTKRPHLVTEAIERCKVLSEEDGMYKVAVKWDLKGAQALAKLKVEGTPSPITRDYEWTGKHEPFAHQRETSAFLTLHKKAFCFNEQGTGKTASVIWAVDYLMNLGHLNVCL